MSRSPRRSGKRGENENQPLMVYAIMTFWCGVAIEAALCRFNPAPKAQGGACFLEVSTDAGKTWQRKDQIPCRSWIRVNVESMPADSSPAKVEVKP